MRSSALPVLLFAVLATSCNAGSERTNAASGPPHVLLVTIDTLRPDRLSAYGFEGHETPHIDRMAAEGALFENALTDTPWTTPSMSSVMTGTYPTVHGFKSTNANRLGLGNETLAEILGPRGFATAAIIGSFPLDSIYQLDQGFDHYDDHFTLPIWRFPGHEPTPLPSEFRERPEAQAMFAMVKAMSDSRRTDADVTDAALRWLEGRPDRPFFLWVHYFGPHTKPDWTLPEEERVRQQYTQYDPDVRGVDVEMGRLLGALEAAGVLDETLVVFHADHAESLGEQGYIGHGMLLNDATMHIPLILRYPPRVEPGARIPQQVRNVDVFPTILDAVGVPIPERTSGASLLPLVAPGLGGDGGGEPERVAYMETYYTAHVAFAPPVHAPDGTEHPIGRIHRSVRSGRWQLIRTDPHPLMDVSDPAWDDVPEAVMAATRAEILVDATQTGKLEDRTAEHPEIAARLRRALDAHLAEESGPIAPALPVDAETRLRLESLGYGGGKPDPAPRSALQDADAR